MNIRTGEQVRIVIFTDLDGTLLDASNYSCEVTAPLVTKLENIGIPVVFCSSKTRAEQEVYQRILGISEPFIVENGSAIYIGIEYFPFQYKYKRTFGNYHIIDLAIPYQKVRDKLAEINKKHGLNLLGFGDMEAEEIARLTNLDLESARLAKSREYEETLILQGSIEDNLSFLKIIEESGLKWNRGDRFYSVSSGSDKGKAVKIITRLFERKLGNVKTIGIGDSYNDRAMLHEVDIPVLVRKSSDEWEAIDIPDIYRTSEVGPYGWVQAIRNLIKI